MPSVLGFIGSADREQWLFPLWLRPLEQGSEVRELDAQPLLQAREDAGLIGQGESAQAVPHRLVVPVLGS